MGLSLHELPTDPIAVTYWEPEEARRRADLLKNQAEKRPQQLGVAEVEDIGRLLGVKQERGSLARYPGRLAFVDPRTAKVTPVPQVPPGAVPLAWSDDHDRLLFLSNHRGSAQVYEYSLSAQEVRPVSVGSENYTYADYGPGRQVVLLAIVSRKGRQFERVYVTNAEGGAPRLVFEDRNAETVRLAPDGKRLLYVRRGPPPPGREEPSWELVDLDLATGEERDMGPGREPSFSPTGDWIVYSAPTRDGWRLRRMRSDGSARSPVTSGIRDETLPTVSPDGQFVAYVGESNKLDRLFVRRMDGSGDRILLEAGAVYAPTW
jgi:Tol biopolymer transport system component